MAAELLEHAKNFRDPFTIDTFRAFVKTHQALLFPAFQMQLALQRKFLGTAFWEKNADRRMEICNGKYISVGAFIAEVSSVERANHQLYLTFLKYHLFFLCNSPSTSYLIVNEPFFANFYSTLSRSQRKQCSL